MSAVNGAHNGTIQRTEPSVLRTAAHMNDRVAAGEFLVNPARQAAV
ncbi:MAG: hypothetical protein JJ897_11560 [Marinibacterium sp.]|nr:hypothetical protein [Marinibacterium sp.]